MVEELKPKKINGKANRRKGHEYERKWAKIFRDLGYNYCKTSRQASRLLDDSKVDLAFIPFNVQCKNVQAGINYIEEIKLVKESLAKNFPPTDSQHQYPVIIAHKKGCKPEDELVVMRADEFVSLLTNKIIEEKKVESLKTLVKSVRNNKNKNNGSSN